jgi:integrase
MPRIGSKGHLWWRKGIAYAIWYRNGSRFCVNTRKRIEEEAQAEMARLMAEAESSGFKKADSIPPTIITLVNEGLRFYRRKGRKSLEHVERHAKRLKAGFAGYRSDEITAEHINAYIEKRLDEGAANATVNRELAFLRLAYNLARKAKRIQAESVPHIEMQPENNRRTGFFEQEQYEGVLSFLPDYLKGVLTMGYWTGMRKAEILSLPWDRVDLFNRLVFLEQTKNGEDRTLPLNDELFGMMREQAGKRVEGCPFVFHRYGERIQSFGKAWRTACKAAGCSGKLVHDLRRTGVRNLIRSGVAQSVAMQISGHKDARIFERYNIVDTRDVAEAMRKVSQYEQEKRLARARQVRDAETAPEGLLEASGRPALPPKVQ